MSKNSECPGEAAGIVSAHCRRRVPDLPVKALVAQPAATTARVYAARRQLAKLERDRRLLHHEITDFIVWLDGWANMSSEERKARKDIIRRAEAGSP